MSSIPRRIAAGLPVVILAAGALLSTGGVAAASTVPPWEPGGTASTDPNEVGGLVLYDSSGNPVTSGNTSDPISAYVQGTTTLRSGDSSASLFGYLPKSGVAPGSWSGEQLAGPTAYPDVNAPAPVSQTLPVVEPGAHDLTIGDLASDYPNTDTSADGYAGLYQIRLRTTGTGSQTTTYDSADIAVSGSTWSIAYTSVPATATTTSLKVSPSSPVFHGVKVKLSAAVSPTSAAGSVQFLDGTKVLKTVKLSGGAASFSTSSLKDAVHKLSAKFVPSTNAFATSKSAAHSIRVKAHPTKVTLKASKASIKKGKKLKLTAKEAPAVAGKVTFFDGSKKLKTVAVKKGKAVFSSTKLKVGSHKLKAKFAPKNAANDAASTSKIVKVKVKR